MPSVYGVPVSVVDVVDVVAVLHGRVPAARAVLVAVRLVDGVVPTRARPAWTGNGISARRRRWTTSPSGKVSAKPASETSTIVAPGRHVGEGRDA